MDKKIYTNLLKSNRLNTLKKLDELESISLPQFHTLNIDCKALNPNYQDKLINQLENYGVTDKSPVLYYFEIINNEAQNIQKLVAQRKSKYKLKDKEYLALPRVNTSDKSKKTKYLYVGKTNKNFISRFKQHLGLLQTNTYALHLHGWAKDLKLKLYIGVVDLKHEKIHLLEEMENILHEHFAPALGRSGH